MALYNCIIVDDEEVARLKTLSFVKKFPIFKIVGVFSSPESAMSTIEKNTIDVAFLDIDMPTQSGLEFRKTIMQIPVCIFITSYPEHALESFELETLDFLLKPLQLDRFTQTVERIEEFLENKRKVNLFETKFGDDVVYIKKGHEQIKIKLYDILYIEALKDYTLLVTNSKRHCVFMSIGNLLKEKNFESFIRFHRSYAVQKHNIVKMDSHFITLQEEMKLPIGLSFKDNLNTILL